MLSSPQTLYVFFMDIFSFIKDSDLFNGMNDELILRVSQNAVEKKFSRNEILFLEESTGVAFYLLVKGEVRLYKTTPDGREITVRVIQSGEMFGEVILFENDLYPVSAIAISACRVFEIRKRFFLSLLDDADFRNEFIMLLMRKQRFLTDRIVYLTSYDVEDRFFRFIKERYGVKHHYDVDISKKEIASAIGTIPETLSRLIQRLKKQGILTWEGKLIQIREGYLESLDADQNSDIFRDP